MAYFSNRIEAGSRLAQALKEFSGERGVVLAIPRGGVVVGYEIAQKLHLELDVIIPRKLGAPHNPELAIGAIAEDGTAILDDNLIAYLGVNEDYIRQESEHQKLEIKRRLKLYRQDAPPINIKGRNVLVVDDGIATGSTMKAALISLRKQGAKKVVVAVPVGPPSTINELGKMTDKVVCLYMPEYFQAIGQFYEDFNQTSDDEVIELLRKNKHEFPNKRSGVDQR
ncbi:MAG: phosphoribosyltransferase [Betaproteobacteria bacterium]